MSGEYSKTIGEIGEDIVSNFFNLIGWNSVAKGSTLTCQKKSKHTRDASKGTPRQTHGIDFLFSYKTPLEQDTLQNVVVSVKHTNQPYESNPKATFKNHIKDLAQTLECFKYSELKTERQQMVGKFRKHQDTGVLFWLSSSDNTYDNLVEKVSNINLDTDLLFDTFHVVDNKCITFIFDVVTYLRGLSDYNLTFYYPETSLNYKDPDKTRSGSILPVEFLTSPVIPFILKDKERGLDIFCLASSEQFNVDSLRRLIKAADEYTSEISCKYLFLFPNYVESKHKGDFVKATLGFGKPSEYISVKSYLPDFRSLNHD